jgi:microcystin-dependent protein
MPTIGEIRMFAGKRVPQGWYACDGSLIQITPGDALHSLIGTTYGGDGTTTYAVPDLRGRLPVGAGQLGGFGPLYPVGQYVGEAQVTLTINNVPPHSHTLNGTTNAPTTTVPGPNVMPAQPPANVDPYNDISVATGPAGTFGPAAIGANPSQQLPIDNHMPSIGLMFIIAHTGVYPSA